MFFPGAFTAPQKGAYLFTFTTLGTTSHHCGAVLKKNDTILLTTWKNKPEALTNSATVIVPLDAGDIVTLMTRGSDYKVYSHAEHETTFSGVLLFTL